VLGGADLVVAVLDVDAELLEGEDGLPPDIGSRVERREVEVAALVEGLGGLAVAEEEVLELGADVEDVEAHRPGPLNRAAEDVSGVPLVGRPLWCEDVAEHPGDALLLRAPGKHGEGRRVGHRDHVGLFDRVEAGDRGSVEADATLE